MEEMVETANARGYIAEGGLRFAREVLEQSVGVAARRRDPEPPVGGDRDDAVRVPAPHAARPDRGLPAQRAPADGRAGRRAAARPRRSRAKVMELLDAGAAGRRRRCASRMMGQTSPDVVKEVALVMERKLETVLQREYAAAGGVRSLAAILNAANRSTERNILEHLADGGRRARRRGALAALRLRGHPQAGRPLDPDGAARGRLEGSRRSRMRGASEDVQAKILDNMSQRGAEMLREEMEYMPPQRRRVVEEAQTKIVARRAQARGRRRARDLARRRATRTTSSLADTFEFSTLEAPARPGRRDRRRPRSACAPIAARARQRPRRGGPAAAALAEARARRRAALAAPSPRPSAGRARATTVPRARPSAAAVELALAIAEKIVGAALELGPSWCSSVVAGALLRTTDRDQLVLEVNPDDFELVARRAPTSSPRRLGGIHRDRRRRRAARRAAAGASSAPRRARSTRGSSAQLERARARRRGRRRPTPAAPRARRADASLDRARRYARPSPRPTCTRRRGRVTNLIGLVIEATGLRAEVGELVTIPAGRNRPPVPAEVVGFRDGPHAAHAARRDARHRPGHAASTATGEPFRVPGRRRACSAACSTGSAGRSTAARELERRPAPAPSPARPPSPMHRARASPSGSTLGVRALDALVPVRPRPAPRHLRRLGRRQVDAARHRSRASTTAVVNVICLVGERGRELLEFIERDLGAALERSVVVVATSDQPALVRIKAALVGDDDRRALPRPGPRRAADDGLGHALRDGPARGRPRDRRAAGDARLHAERVRHAAAPARARRARRERGSITGLYTVLVEGDDMNEPVADAVRSILDGHCVLSRALAHKNHYPAIDVLQSVSRLADRDHDARGAGGGRRAARDARRVPREGGPDHDRRLHRRRATRPSTTPSRSCPQIDAFLRQRADEVVGGSRHRRRPDASSWLTGTSRVHSSPVRADYPDVMTTDAGGLMSTAETTRQLVIFSLGSEEYALPITRVQEIIRYTEPRMRRVADAVDPRRHQPPRQDRARVRPGRAARPASSSARRRQDRHRRDPDRHRRRHRRRRRGGHDGRGRPARGRPDRRRRLRRRDRQARRPPRDPAESGRPVRRRPDRRDRLGGQRSVRPITGPPGRPGASRPPMPRPLTPTFPPFASSSPTTRPSCARDRRRPHGAGRGGRRGRPPTATRRSSCARSTGPTSCRSTSPCPAWTASACCGSFARAAADVAVVVVSAFSPAHGARAVDALAEGAVELVAKPEPAIRPGRVLRRALRQDASGRRVAPRPRTARPGRAAPPPPSQAPARAAHPPGRGDRLLDRRPARARRARPGPPGRPRRRHRDRPAHAPRLHRLARRSGSTARRALTRARGPPAATGSRPARALVAPGGHHLRLLGRRPGAR